MVSHVRTLSAIVTLSLYAVGPTILVVFRTRCALKDVLSHAMLQLAIERAEQAVMGSTQR